MSSSTAELTAIDSRAHSSADAAAWWKWFRGGRLYWTLAALALIVGALSLLIPSTPSYDPWAWIVWGREIVHFKLDTTGGPSWKPLPMIFTTVFAAVRQGRAEPVAGRRPRRRVDGGVDGVQARRPADARGSDRPGPLRPAGPTLRLDRAGCSRD